MNNLLLLLLFGCSVVDPVRSFFGFDFDPCRKHPCDHYCKGSVFGYECYCRPGFVLNSRNRKTCIPLIGKCDHGYQPSKSDPSKCVAIIGKCDEGFEPSKSDHSKCVDINECAQRPSPCGHICTNYEGSYECSCRSGFVLSDNDYKTCHPPASGCDEGYEPSKSDPSKCVDKNECAQSVPPCGQICTNYEGSYECSCNKGFTLSDADYRTCLPTANICDKGFEPSKADPSKCVDINECETKKPCGQICTNYEGSYECSCNHHFTLSEEDYSTCIPSKCDDGFERSKSDPTKCVDINECARDKKPCAQICTNYEGSYECSCRRGFTLSDTDYKSCHQVDNCKNRPCEQVCASVETNYKCSCREGYVISKSDPKKCEVVDFCKDKPCQHTCTSTPKGASCSCKEGFQISKSDPKKCEAIDFCKDKPCQQLCTSTTNTYKCSCKEGFQISKSDPKKCEAIDFCESKPCQQVCTSTTTGFKCSCNQGFEISKTDSNKCEAIDFCKSKPCQQICTSTSSNFKCSCNPGFEISKTDSTKCEKIDFCKSKPCQQVCTSTSSNFKCSCNPGFEISKTDATKCEAIDFCKSKPCQQVCTSTSSNFKCSCNPGFEISKTDATKCEAGKCDEGMERSKSDPTKCVDINECAGEQKVCHQICTNYEASYECSCEPGYVLSNTDFKTCIPIDPCKSKPCEQVCTSSAAGFKCSCNEGFLVSKSDPNKCEAITSCKSDSCAHICTNSSTGFKCSCKEGYAVNSKDSTKCDDIDECTTKKPCQHNCKNVDGSYKCSCNEGWEVDSKDFTKCSEIKICNKPVDIIFVIDSSASVGTVSNKIQVQFASNIAKHFTVGPNNALFGAILFGNNPSKLFDLKDYKTGDQVSQKLLSSPYLREQSTGTDKALKFITTEKMFSEENGGRPNADDYVVVLTDGKSTNPTLTANEAKTLKSSNTKVIAVGIGKEAQKSELETIASNKESVFLVPDFDSLNYIEQALSKITCPD